MGHTSCQPTDGLHFLDFLKLLFYLLGTLTLRNLTDVTLDDFLAIHSIASRKVPHPSLPTAKGVGAKNLDPCRVSTFNDVSRRTFQHVRSVTG